MLMKFLSIVMFQVVESNSTVYSFTWIQTQPSNQVDIEIVLEVH